MEQFFILDQQNEGIKVPLYRPDGALSGHSFTIYGHFSDIFQRTRRDILGSASADFKRIGKDDAKREEALEERRLRLVAALIKDWSFDLPCIEVHKVRFLKHAPQIADMIDRVAGEQELFTKASLSSSSPGSNGTSDSPAQLQDQQPACEDS